MHQTRGIMTQALKFDNDGDGYLTLDDELADNEEVRRLFDDVTSYWINVAVISALVLTLTIPSIFEPPEAHEETEFTDTTIDFLIATYGIMMAISTSAMMISISICLNNIVHFTLKMPDVT
eukprot:UN06806